MDKLDTSPIYLCVPLGVFSLVVQNGGSAHTVLLNIVRRLNPGCQYPFRLDRGFKLTTDVKDGVLKAELSMEFAGHAGWKKIDVYLYTPVAARIPDILFTETERLLWRAVCLQRAHSQYGFLISKGLKAQDMTQVQFYDALKNVYGLNDTEVDFEMNQGWVCPISKKSAEVASSATKANTQPSKENTMATAKKTPAKKTVTKAPEIKKPAAKKTTASKPAPILSLTMGGREYTSDLARGPAGPFYGHFDTKKEILALGTTQGQFKLLRELKKGVKMVGETITNVVITQVRGPLDEGYAIVGVRVYSNDDRTVRDFDLYINA